MDVVRKLIKRRIDVHVWLRPVLNAPDHPRHGQDYNRFIGGAKGSAHRIGSAMDWSSKTVGSCDVIRAKLEKKLEELGLRMEKLPGSGWIHNDNMPVVYARYFKP